MKRLTSYGGIAASIVLIAFGIGAVVVGLTGGSQVRSDLAREQVVGTPDMTPKAIAAEAQQAHLTNVSLPTCSVAGQKVANGASARCFADYMRIHALESTGGKTYAQMPSFLDKSGKPTENKAAAAIDPKTGQAMQNPARNVWVTETALTTALNTSYFATQVSLFSVVMGVAMLLIGIGFGVLTLSLLPARRARAEREPAAKAALAT